jgi:hypothetical protein
MAVPQMPRKWTRRWGDSLTGMKGINGMVERSLMS